MLNYNNDDDLRHLRLRCSSILSMLSSLQSPISGDLWRITYLLSGISCRC